VRPARSPAWACGGALALLALAVAAQPYPSRPVRLILPYPPGGATDIVARALGQKLGDALGQQFVIDNRGGGGQVIGTALAAEAAPDGYTLILVTITHTINPALHRKLPYDSLADFTPVTLVAASPQILVAHPSVAAKSVSELIALAKAKPGGLNYASSGNGSGGHLAMELFKSMTGVQMTHVPYKGAGPALTDLIGGQVQVMFTSPLAALPHVKTGKLRGIAMASRTRSQAAPDLPTVAETVPGYEASLWYALLGPARLPQPVVATLNAETIRALRLPDVAERLTGQGVEPAGGTPAELAAFMKSETAKWGKVVREARIGLD
jgi:tripartite-type tricarboxylate transporter receptor subunit TctC